MDDWATLLVHNGFQERHVGLVPVVEARAVTGSVAHRIAWPGNALLPLGAPIAIVDPHDLSIWEEPLPERHGTALTEPDLQHAEPGVPADRLRGEEGRVTPVVPVVTDLVGLGAELHHVLEGDGGTSSCGGSSSTDTPLHQLLGRYEGGDRGSEHFFPRPNHYQLALQ